MFSAKVVLDSIAPCGRRLITVEASYARFIHSEVLTHRDRERNSGSARAKPASWMMDMVTNDPVIPIFWGSEQRGMKTGGAVDDPVEAQAEWLRARDSALAHAKRLTELGVHKSLVNRVIEPYCWISTVMSSTEWNNFFRLRAHPDAEIHFQQLAYELKQLIKESEPQELRAGEWHLPYIEVDDYDTVIQHCLKAPDNPPMIEILKRASVARCTRVSYWTHGTNKKDIAKDLALFETLMSGSGFGHWSPLGHVASACSELIQSGPFIGWKQFRKEFNLENVEG